MSSRIARLFFDLLPARAAEIGDASIADALPAAPAPTNGFLGQLRQKLLSDEALVEHLQKGNADALRVLFERHSPLLFAIGRRILRNEAEAEDAVQQIFIDVFRSIHRFDPEKGKFKTWLLMFGYQRILNCRRALVSHRFFDTDPFDELVPDVPPSSPDYSLAEISVLIEQALSHLQFRQRRTIELIYYEGLTAEEVAGRTGETVRVVRHNLYRGLEKLRAAISETKKGLK
jgi:RNA polymerase sigma-70 factor, ECF subfamily